MAALRICEDPMPQWPGVDVAGVSWGGMLAQEFAYRHPNLVNRLVLVATSAGMPMIPGSPSTLRAYRGMSTFKRFAKAGTFARYWRSRARTT